MSSNTCGHELTCRSKIYNYEISPERHVRIAVGYYSCVTPSRQFDCAKSNFNVFVFPFFLLVGACKSYFVALVLLLLRYAYDLKYKRSGSIRHLCRDLCPGHWCACLRIDFWEMQDLWFRSFVVTLVFAAERHFKIHTSPRALSPAWTRQIAHRSTCWWRND